MAQQNCHKGSAPAMEVEGTKRIFGRSIQKFNLRYSEFYGDGDSKSFSSVEHFYQGLIVVKKECIGHVQKRVGNRLRKLKKSTKGLGGKGKLTDTMIDRLQNYYSIAIRSNVGNLVMMQTAVNVSLFHCASTGKNNFHDVYCPAGKESWCSYQRDKALGTADHKPGAGLPTELLVKYVKPIFNELGNTAILMKCLHGKTQKQNESFNAMIWNRIPKETYVGFTQFQL